MKAKLSLPLLLISCCFLASQCSKNSPDQSALLPPVSSTGANTFGCLVDGRALLPRDGVANFDVPYPHKGIEAVFGGSSNVLDLEFYNARDVKPLGFFLDLHLFDSNNIQLRKYIWHQTSYGVANSDNQLHHIYGSFYDSEINNYAWFGSYDNSGSTTITRIDSINHIISGSFSGKLRKENGTKEITITNGRFDINVVTVNDKKFP